MSNKNIKFFNKITNKVLLMALVPVFISLFINGSLLIDSIVLFIKGKVAGYIEMYERIQDMECKKEKIFFGLIETKEYTKGFLITLIILTVYFSLIVKPMCECFSPVVSSLLIGTVYTLLGSSYYGFNIRLARREAEVMEGLLFSITYCVSMLMVMGFAEMGKYLIGFNMFHLHGISLTLLGGVMSFILNIVVMKYYFFHYNTNFNKRLFFVK